MTETEQTESQGVRGDDDEPQMPGSFDMSTAPLQQEPISWLEMLKKIGSVTLLRDLFNMYLVFCSFILPYICH